MQNTSATTGSAEDDRNKTDADSGWQSHCEKKTNEASKLKHGTSKRAEQSCKPLPAEFPIPDRKRRARPRPETPAAFPQVPCESRKLEKLLTRQPHWE